MVQLSSIEKSSLMMKGNGDDKDQIVGVDCTVECDWLFYGVYAIIYPIYTGFGTGCTK